MHGFAMNEVKVSGENPNTSRKNTPSPTPRAPNAENPLPKPENQTAGEMDENTTSEAHSSPEVKHEISGNLAHICNLMVILNSRTGVVIGVLSIPVIGF